MLWVPDPGRGVQITNTNGTFCCQEIDCSPDPKISTLAHGLPLTTISIIESSGQAFLISGTSASSSSSRETAGVTRSTLGATTTTEPRGAETTSLLPSLASHNPSQQTSLITIFASPSASATVQSQTPPTTAHSSSESVKLGLGISIPIVTLSAILASATLWLKRRTRRKQAGDFVSGEQPLASYHGDGGPVAMDRQGMDNTPLELGERGRYSRYGELIAETRTPRQELPASKRDDGGRAGGPPPMDRQGMDDIPPELAERGRYSRYGELAAETRTSRQELPASKPDEGRRAIRFNTGPWRWLERGSEPQARK